MTKPEEERRRYRQIVVECSALVDLLNELYPPRLPSLNATDREIGSAIGQWELVERLNKLRAEANETAAGELPQLLNHGGRR
jgi:hypothetical protein